MKQLAFSLAVASTIALPPQGFAVGPIDGTIYGRINVSVVNADNGTSHTYKLNSNASRLGIKGESEIANGLYAIYKAEVEICVDDGDCDGRTFTQRNIVGGIRGRLGTVWAGKHDSPTKLAQNKIDLFNDLEGDIKSTFEGENRVSNIVAYTSPTMNGFSTMVAIIPGEGADLDSDGIDDRGLTDGMSYSISYNVDNVYMAIAGDQDVDSQDLTRVVAKYKMDALKVGIMYQQNEDNVGTKDESGFFVSAAYQLDERITVKVQYGSIEDDADGDEEQTLSLGGDYKLAKGTKIYMFYTDNTDSSIGKLDDENSTFGLGVEHNF